MEQGRALGEWGPSREGAGVLGGGLEREALGRRGVRAPRGLRRDHRLLQREVRCHLFLADVGKC